MEKGRWLSNLSPFSPRLHERKANFPNLNFVEIMTKKIILVANEAQQQIRRDELLVTGTILKSLHAE